MKTMTPQQIQLDDLLRQMIELIDEAEDKDLVPPHLTYTITVDGCKVVEEWRETEHGLVSCPPKTLFDNTLGAAAQEMTLDHHRTDQGPGPWFVREDSERGNRRV